jgi:hypothetical protein
LSKLRRAKLVPYAAEIADAEYRAKFLNGLHERIELNSFQLEVAGNVFAGKNVVASVGRKAGKSTCVQYIATRKAALFKRSYIYVILPTVKQAREIYWEQLIIPDICPPGFITKMSRTELRITFSSGSFIKFDGSDNPELHRGPAVHLFVVDELKDCEPKLMPAMLPNLLATKGTFAMFGTPPDEAESPKAKMWFEMVERPLTDKTTIYIEGKSEENPFNDKNALRKERERLIAAGQEDVWLREYCGQFKRSQVESIFPMFTEIDHVFKTGDVLDEALALSRSSEPGQWEWWLIQDPGSSSVFGHLYIGYYKPLAMVYIVDEAYVTDPKRATVLEMYRVEMRKMGAIEPDLNKWINVYDEQASWFPNERAQMGAAGRLVPTDKNKWRTAYEKDLKAGLTTVRDMLTYKRVKIADRCENLIREIRGYRKKHVKRKSQDHLIDCLRYFVLKSFYTIPKEIIDDLSMIPDVVREKVQESVAARQLSDGQLEAMMENDISEFIIAEALEWDGF